MKTLVSICARGNSKGLPNKNILPILSKPLIGYSIDCAKKIQKLYPKSLIHIELSTDSRQIIKVAEECGLKTNYLRPNELATDTSGKIPVLEDLLNYAEKKHELEYDFLLDLDVSSPLRTVEDIKEAFDRIQKTPEALNIFSVSPAHKNPYFNMVELQNSGYAKLVKGLDQKVLSRQKAPEVFEMNASFYIYRKKFFDEKHSSAITDKSLTHCMDHICFDIDKKIDFEFLNFLMTQNKLRFDI